MQNGNDFQSCALVTDTIYSAWGDVRSGKLNIYFAKTSDSTGLGTGIISIDQQEGNSLTVFPNPADETLTIDCPNPENEKWTIRLTSMDGKEDWLKPINAVTFPFQFRVHAVPAGAYLINLRNENGESRVSRVVIQH
jgi:hypothetical protein